MPYDEVREGDLVMPFACVPVPGESGEVVPMLWRMLVFQINTIVLV